MMRWLLTSEMARVLMILGLVLIIAFGLMLRASSEESRAIYFLTVIVILLFEGYWRTLKKHLKP